MTRTHRLGLIAATAMLGLAAAAPAEADYYRRGYYNGGGVAAGIVGGVALGAIIGGLAYRAAPPPVYYAPAPRVYYAPQAYYAPPPVYYAPRPRAYYAPPPVVVYKPY